MGERVLTRRDLNRALLARQLLLVRSEISIPRALERLGGVQAQYAPSMYIGLWTRLEAFDRDALTRLLGRRTVVLGTLMRITIHLVARRDYWPFALATREARRRSWLTSRRGQLSDADMVEAAGLVRERLAATSPLHRSELEEIVGKARAPGVGLWVDLVRVPPSGTWERRRADLFGLAEEWAGAPEGTAQDGVEHLVRRYLAAFGPASRADIASFTGLVQRDLATALERIRLRRFRSEAGEELLDVERAPLPDPATPAPVRFLPTFDPNLLVHARRTGILPEEYRPRLFSTRTPHPEPAFLVDGAVAGTWRYDGGRVRLTPFEALDASVLRELRQEAERLAEWHG